MACEQCKMEMKGKMGKGKMMSKGKKPKKGRYRVGTGGSGNARFILK